jgi:hypothetical protein
MDYWEVVDINKALTLTRGPLSHHSQQTHPPNRLSLGGPGHWIHHLRHLGDSKLGHESASAATSSTQDDRHDCLPFCVVYALLHGWIPRISGTVHPVLLHAILCHHQKHHQRRPCILSALHPQRRVRLWADLPQHHRRQTGSHQRRATLRGANRHPGILPHPRAQRRWHGRLHSHLWLLFWQFRQSSAHHRRPSHAGSPVHRHPTGDVFLVGGDRDFDRDANWRRHLKGFGILGVVDIWRNASDGGWVLHLHDESGSQGLESPHQSMRSEA